MRRSARLAVAAVVGIQLLLSGSAHAAGTPAQSCAGAKMKAAGKSAGLKLACHAKAARRGETVDSSCLARATAKLASSFAKAESRGGCITTGDASGITDMIDSSVGAFVAALRPTTSANRCAGVKLNATGKKVTTRLGCHGKATRKGAAVDPQCLAKADARFSATFTGAEAHGPCLTNGDAGDIEDQVDDLVNDVVAALPSGSGTTTTTTLGAVCGNGIVEGNEQCDTNPEPICVSSGRSGCFPAGNPEECNCCTTPGETGLIDVGGTVPNECCDGQTPQPAGPGAYFCPGTCGTMPFPTCGGSCQPGRTCVALRFAGVDQCGCVLPGPCGGTPPACTVGECPAGQVCSGDACACFAM
jgi:hypothetical protein